LNSVIPGRRSPKGEGEPGIHTHEVFLKTTVPDHSDLCSWIPGSPLRGAPE
jgi:hypothetical protein